MAHVVHGGWAVRADVVRGAAALLAALAVTAAAVPAHAARDARAPVRTGGPELRRADTCTWIGNDLVCHGRGVLPPAGGGDDDGPVRDPSAPSERPAFTWRWLADGSTCVEYAGGDPAVERFLERFVGGIGERPFPTYLFPTGELDRLQELAPGATVVGPYGYAVAVAADGSPLLTFIARCVPDGEPTTPPTPPSAVEVWGLAALPRPVIRANPAGTAAFPGLTGLDTLVWSAPLAPVAVDAELRGYRITAAAHPVGWVLTTPDGAAHATEGPPSATTPTRVRFERRGGYRLSLAVRWTGTFSVRAPQWGIDIAESPLGTTSVAVALPYLVTEVRTRLVPGP